MLARFPLALDIRELRLLGGVMLALALAAVFAVPAFGAFAWIDKTHRVLSVACGILAGSAVYEPLQRVRPAVATAAATGSAALLGGVAVVVQGFILRPMIGLPQRPLYEACIAAALVAGLLVADRMRAVVRLEESRAL